MSTETTPYVRLGRLPKDIYRFMLRAKSSTILELKRAVRVQAELHQPGVILIEDKGSGTQLSQELISERMYAVKVYQPGSMDKGMGMSAQTGAIENGFIRLPATAEWLDNYLHELTTFPAGQHGDQVGSTAQVLHWLKVGRKPEPGFMVWMEQQLREQGLPIQELPRF